MIDQEVFDTLKQLPDSFWVFAEFNIGRNVDWFIIRPENPSTLILTELKRISRPLRGAVNGLWEKQDQNGDWEELPANASDANPYWQAVNSANALADWLWNNQQLYRETADIRPSAEFRVWPDLLLLSPAGIIHRLPLAPPSRYGRWWFSMDDWVRHVHGWTPRSGVAMTPREVANLVEALRLTEIWSGNGDAPPETSHFVESSPSSEPASFASWLQMLEQRVARLERELATLRGQDQAPNPDDDIELEQEHEHEPEDDEDGVEPHSDTGAAFETAATRADAT
ncbi:MAG TPA: hypothetical protein VMM78_05005 [Thermomicrobiales bacterium]|nr:hypothetical protein [Thermomicrobiales bacterium]